MKTTTTKKTKVTSVAPGAEPKIKVTLPPTFTARVNQMAHRKGKAHADMWRASTMGALQKMADEGAPIDELSKALAGIEADPLGEKEKLIEALAAQFKGD